MSVETYQGRPCARGHAGVRLLSNRKCVECNRADRRAQYAVRKEAEKIQLARAKRLRDALNRETLYALLYPQDFDNNGWHRAGRAYVEY